MKIVKEKLLEVLRSEDDWANQQIAKNVERYKNDEVADNVEDDVEDTIENTEQNEAMSQFLMSTSAPLYVVNRALSGNDAYQINIEGDEEYSIIVIHHQNDNHDLEYEFFNVFKKAFMEVIGRGQFNNVKEIMDSEGGSLFII